MPAARAALTSFCLLVLACGAREETPSQPASTRQEGAHFDFVTPSDGPFVARSKDVEVRRVDSAIVLHFPTIAFERASNEQGEITLGTLSVRLTHPDHPEADKQRDADLNRLVLTTDQPLATTHDVRVRIDDAADECTKGCSLFAGVYYSIRKSATELTSSGVGAFVDVNLASGTAALRPAQAPSSSTVAGARADPCPFTPARASDALGQAMKYRNTGFADCVMVPESGSAFNIAVMKNANYYDRLAIASDAQPVSLGERAMWLPGVAMVCAQRGAWTVAVQIGEPQTPAPPTDDTRHRAETMAKKLLEKLFSRS